MSTDNFTGKTHTRKGGHGHDIVEREHVSGLWFHAGTDPKVCDAIALAHSCGYRVRLFIGDTVTGKCWHDEFGTVGTIGRSTGQVKCPLLIANVRSSGGFAILDHCVIGIATGPHAWLYRHPSLDLGVWSIGLSDLPDYARNVSVDGTLHARFKTHAQAERYVAFMRGERFAK